MGSVGHSHCEATKLEMNHTKLARPESGKAAITLSKTKTGPGGAISNSVQYKSRQPLPLYLTLTRNFHWREGPTDFDQHPTFSHPLIY